ncbi:TPA: hypothetical protein HA265_08430, partial [Candidatus Woesearchaeota archaeon]|nr:hypothetical protein [Candidatus Woesearchaeota archaeon]
SKLPDVWVVPGKITDDLWLDNIITYIRGEPSLGLQPGQAGIAVAAPGVYRPSHPYFNVPYSVDPSFSITIPYDLSIYETVPHYLANIEICKSDLECIMDDIAVIEQDNPDLDWVVKYGGNVITRDKNDNPEYPAWEAYCENSDQHAINSIAEAIDNCARSQDKGCVCPYTLPIVTDAEVEQWKTGEEQSAVAELLGMMSLAFNDIFGFGEDERLITFTKSGSDLRISKQPAGTTTPQLVSKVVFGGVTAGLDLRGASAMELKYDPGIEQKTIEIYKDKIGNITIRKKTDADPVCGLNNKMMKFCIVQDKTFFAYDQQTNRMGLQQVVLKFAYEFKSDVTDVKNFEVYDAKFATNTSLLIWDPVEGFDADSYVIYYSAIPTMENSLSTQSPSEINPEDIPGLEYVELDATSSWAVSITKDSLFSPVCEVIGTICEKRYVLESVIGEGVLPEPLFEDILYQSIVDDKFFYFLPNIENDKRYFFAITAKEGDRESPSFNLPAQTHEDSFNDIPPGMAEVNVAIDDRGTLRANINPIDYNIDGSYLEPDFVEQYKIYCIDDAYAEEYVDLSSKEALFGVGIQQKVDKTIEFERPLADFTDAACGFTSSPKKMRIVVAGVRTAYGIDYDFKGNISTDSFSEDVLEVPEYG